MSNALLAFLLGLALGSFVNVLITRLPFKEPFWAGRSRCPRCGATLAWHDNVPLLSYLRLKGRCRHCQGTISWRYPAVELAGGLLAIALWLRFPFSPLLCAYVPFTFALLALSVIDLEHGLLPDALTLPGLALGLGLAFFLPHPGLMESCLGAFAGWAALGAIRWVYARLAGRQGMGGGDVKLMAMAGAFLGIRAVPWVIFLGAALGSLAGLAWLELSSRGRTGWRTVPIPFGPFLAAAAFSYLMLGEEFFLAWGW